MLLDTEPKFKLDSASLIKAMKTNKMKYKITNVLINERRNAKREEIEADLQKLMEQKELNDKGPYPKLQAINKYFLYGGLCKFYE